MTGKPRLNKMIDLLEQGQIAFCPMTVDNGNEEELIAIADSSYDFVIIDMEHFNFDFPTLKQSLSCLLNRKRIAQKGSLQPDVVPLVRVPPNAREMNQWIIKQTLDAGPYGIVIPHLSTVEEARAVVAAMRYPRPVGEPPALAASHGMRGWYPKQAARYWGLSAKEYYEAADLWPLNPRGELFLMAIVESREGVENLPQILKEEKGISAIWAGPGDLSVSLGYAGDTKHPKVEEAIQRILTACLEHNVPCCGLADSSNMEARIKQGFRIIMTKADRSFEAIEHGRRAAGRPG